MRDFIPGRRRGRSALALPRHAQVEIVPGKLFRQQNDLPGVQLQMTHDLEDRLENGVIEPRAVGLRVDSVEQPFFGDGAEDAARLIERREEAAAGLGQRGGWSDGEFVVALADVRLAVDAVQNPLADVAFEMQQQIGDGVLVISAATPGLLLSKLLQAADDLLPGAFGAGVGEGEEVLGDGLHGWNFTARPLAARARRKNYHGQVMGFPMKVCVACGEEFELKPDKPGFANRCLDCSTGDSMDPVEKRRMDADERKNASEANEARRQAMKELLYRKDS